METCKTHQYDAGINFLLTEIYRQLIEHQNLNHIPRQKCPKFGRTFKRMYRFERCLSHEILQRSPLLCSFFNTFSLGCLLFFTSLFYGTAMNNHKASWGYSITRKKPWMLTWLPESCIRQDIWAPADVDPFSICLHTGRKTQQQKTLEFSHFQVFSWSSVFCSPYPSCSTLALRLTILSNFIFT